MTARRLCYQSAYLRWNLKLVGFSSLRHFVSFLYVGLRLIFRHLSSTRLVVIDPLLKESAPVTLLYPLNKCIHSFFPVSKQVKTNIIYRENCTF